MADAIVHMALGETFRWSMCGKGGGMTKAVLTTIPQEVTCGSCIKSSDCRMVSERRRRVKAELADA